MWFGSTVGEGSKVGRSGRETDQAEAGGPCRSLCLEAVETHGKHLSEGFHGKSLQRRITSALPSLLLRWAD